MKNIFRIIFFLSAAYCLVSAISVNAQALPRVYLERVGQFGLQILLDAPDPVNAYNIAVRYDPAVAEIEKVVMVNSIVTILPRPVRAARGQIEIKGGGTIPFIGNRGVLATMQLRPISAGVSSFVVEQALVYRADGTGTALAAERAALQLSVTPATFLAYESQSTEPDHAPPVFTQTEVRDNPLRYGERLVVFDAHDNESGIEHFEERERAWLSWSPWRLASNPFVVDPGVWHVQLRAVDLAGNAALASVYELGIGFWHLGLAFAGLTAIVLLIRRLRAS